VRKHFVQDIPSDEADIVYATIVYATLRPLAVRCFGDKITVALDSGRIGIARLTFFAV
jgi:hypothetical protein